MTLNEVIEKIENKIGKPVSLKMLISLFENNVITVNKKQNFHFGIFTE